MLFLLLGTFAVGVCVLQTCAALPAQPLAIIAGAMLLLVVGQRGSRARRRALVYALAGAVFGFGYAAWRAEVRLADELPRQWEAVDLRIVGVVSGLPSISPQGARFAFDVERVDTPGAIVPARLSLAWYAGVPFGRTVFDGPRAGSPIAATPAPAVNGVLAPGAIAVTGQSASSVIAPAATPLAGSGPNRTIAPAGIAATLAAESSPAVRTGERWALTVRLKRPHGTVNPGGFDLEAWLLANGFRATGYVHGDADARRLHSFAGRPDDYIQRARERIRARINAALPGAPLAGVVVALTVGDQRAVPEPQWRIFNRTGVSHLISISGLHVTVFATLIGGAAAALARRSARLTTCIPAIKLGALVGACAAGVYVLLAGAEVPALRTLFMLLVAAGGLWCGRPGTAGLVWLWALVIVLAWDPWAPLAAGFWLSFTAVGLLLYASIGRLRASPPANLRARVWSNVTEASAGQWVVTIGLIPLSLLLFQQFSLVAPLANAVAIPVVTLSVVPLVLTGIVLPFDWLFELAHFILTLLMRVLVALAELPHSAWEQHAPPVWTIVVAMAGVLWLLAPRGVPGRHFGLFALLPLVIVRPSVPADGAFRLTVLDVGQGLASVVQTHRHTLIYDTGPRFTESTDAGGRIVAPFLRAIGIARADGAVISHSDLDHAGGALSLLQTVPIDWLASSLPELHPIAIRVRTDGAAMRCIAGQRWTWDGVEFIMLHPTTAEYADAATRPNDLSCVVHVKSAFGTALLAGDIEANSEARLWRTDGGALRADIIVVPHHGSRTSSTAPFIAAVAPRIAIISAGYRNRFGHPRADVVERYEQRGVQVLRTDMEGALRIDVGPGADLAVQRARAQTARYWLDLPQANVAPAD